jgi:hypothetical protein
MRHWWKGSVVVALLILTQVTSAQEALEHPIKPPHFDTRLVRPNSAASLDPKVRELVRQKFILDGIHESAAKLNWEDVEKQSRGLDQLTHRSLFSRPRRTVSDDPIWDQEFRKKLTKVSRETTLLLAEESLRSGDPVRAMPLFREVIAAAPEEATLWIRSRYKEASLGAADAHYENGDWPSAVMVCDEILKQQYVSLDKLERGHLFLTQQGSQNWSEAASLPGHTLVVHRIPTELGAYFHVFGEGTGGRVDVWVRADTLRDLVGHPGFRPARDQIDKGSDLLLTPSITTEVGAQELLRHSFPNTTLWSDPYIGEASESLAVLQKAKLKPADFELAILLPKNEQQQTAMGLKWTEMQREHAWKSAEYLMSNARGASLVTQDANRTGILGQVGDWIGTDSKKAVMNSLTKAKGVIILFAHGDRNGISTLEGQTLTRHDVHGVDLHKNHPIVLLISCEGNGRGRSDASSSLAQELKESGATAVLSFPEKVDAGEGSSLAVEFLQSVGSGKTPLESFRSLSRDSALRFRPAIHLKVQLRDLPADTKKGLIPLTLQPASSRFRFG